MLHAEVMAHLVGDRGGHQSDHGAVVHAHPATEFVGAHWTFQRFSHYASIKLDFPNKVQNQSFFFFWHKTYNKRKKGKSYLREQLCIIIWMFFDQLFSPIMKEIRQSCISFC